MALIMCVMGAFRYSVKLMLGGEKIQISFNKISQPELFTDLLQRL